MHLNTSTSTLILSLTSIALCLTQDSVSEYSNNIAADILPTKDTIFPTPPPSLSSLLPPDENLAACLTTSNAFCLYAAGTLPQCAETLPPQAQSWVSSVGNSVLKSLTAEPVAFVSALAKQFPALGEVVSENPVLTGGACGVTSASGTVTVTAATATATPKSTPTNTAMKTNTTTTAKTASSATATATATATAKKNIAAGATEASAGLAGALVVAVLSFVAAL